MGMAQLSMTEKRSGSGAAWHRAHEQNINNSAIWRMETPTGLITFFYYNDARRTP
ncbi:hypothetical protein [Pseudomonas indica]|uniref:hypothetical protein n=1 Tax=Pseudomonas indica TaxID=137658 RepID=UPI0020D08B44|nr:hypothetical protein [Pseudomonas indica]